MVQVWPLAHICCVGEETVQANQCRVRSFVALGELPILEVNLFELTSVVFSSHEFCY
jgi:hypothetical protein